MGNKQATKEEDATDNEYRNVDIHTPNDSFTGSPHSPVVPYSFPAIAKCQSLHSQSGPTMTSTSFSTDIDGGSGHRLSLTASVSDTYYPHLAALQLRIKDDILRLVIMHMDILSRLQISICCKHFNEMILSEECLSDVWVIHGLTHKKNTLWEVPIANRLRYHRRMRHKHHQIHQLTKSKTFNALSLSLPNTKTKIAHNRSSSYSFSISLSHKKRVKRRQSAAMEHVQKQHESDPKMNKTLPRSRPPEKIFGFEDIKEENEAEIEEKGANDEIVGKHLVISSDNKHGIVIKQTSSATNLNKIAKRKKHRHHPYPRHAFHELDEYNIVVADFKKYLLQFKPIIRYARCLVVGADNLPNTLRDFVRIRWIPTVMTIEYLVLERNNDAHAADIINSFAYSLKYLSICGRVNETLDLYDLSIFALRICMNFDQAHCEYLWCALPMTLKYLCLYKNVFDCELLNKYLSSSDCNLLHLSLIECSASDSDCILSLASSLISLHLKNFEGTFSCEKCIHLWECVVFVDMKQMNITHIMESLQVCAARLKQIVFFEYNNGVSSASASKQIVFKEWKKVNHLLVVVPHHWLMFFNKSLFEGATFSHIKKDIVYCYDDDEYGAFQNEKEKEFRKELRQRVGSSMFADYYNNKRVGEFNLTKFVRNGHHQFAAKRQK